MLKPGIEHKIVASRLGVGLKSIQRWWHNEIPGKYQNSELRPGRIPKMKKVCKIVISKSLGKSEKLTRKLARILNGKGYSVSQSSIYHYLTNSLGVKSFKRPKIPRLTQEMKDKRLPFAKDHINYTIVNWIKVF
ncbi:hypothetical protein LOD99_10899 [Oopsacas minuta]|uniref:Transposase Tc1-like domain-containing protein n=1 Tax=Oopsacas minuta TaxID=111878 RepID=A0AAV7KCV2_9METZ|nr:hypothetical protein LOD99_10899 [Oopsacas minuta]